MLKRSDITGRTLKLLNIYIEFVLVRGVLKTIAINKGLHSKTFYLLDRGL